LSSWYGDSPEPVDTSSRVVVVLFGPTAAGKSTVARALGLEVYDRDDERWGDSEAAFLAGIARLRDQPQARAVVIRRGMTRTARRRSIADTGATHAFMLAPPEKVCIQRALDRGRDTRREVAAINAWFKGWDRGDDVPSWDGRWKPPGANVPHMRDTDHPEIQAMTGDSLSGPRRPASGLSTPI
jgi:hypothetical protein